VSVLSCLVPVVLTRPVLVTVSPVSPGHRSFNLSIDLSGHPAAVLASRGRGRGALARGPCVQPEFDTNRDLLSATTPYLLLHPFPRRRIR
jgi:hypothetical protein